VFLRRIFPFIETIESNIKGAGSLFSSAALNNFNVFQWY